MPASEPESVHVAVVVVRRGERVLAGPRGAGRSMAGLWELPGGRVESGERPVDAAMRELAEETGLVARSLEPLTLVVHGEGAQPLVLHVFLAADVTGEPDDRDDHRWRWCTLDELAALPQPPANASIVRVLRRRVLRSADPP